MMKSQWPLFMAVLALFISVDSSPARGEEPSRSIKKVRVGTYEYAPLIFRDEKGKPGGFYIDVIEHIAREEGWKLEYVHGSWADNKTMLKKGEIDLALGMSYSEERAKTFAYTEETLYAYWANIYVGESSDIRGLRDLDGKRVAGLKGSIDFDGPHGMKRLARQFDLNCEFLDIDEYEEIFKALQDGRADAGVVDRSCGPKYEKEFSVQRTQIVISPSDGRIAFSKSGAKTPTLRAVIDRHLSELRRDPESIYHKSLALHLSAGVKTPVLPRWAKTTLMVGGVLLGLFLFTTLVTHYQVKRKTRELRRSERNYREVFNGTNEAIIIHDDETGEIVDVNQTMLDLFGYASKEEVLRLTVADISANRDQYTGEEAKRWMEKAVKEGTQLVQWCCRRADGSEFYTEVGLTSTEISGQGRLLAAVRDITSRREAEKARRESEEKFRTLTETLAAFVVLVQGDEIVYVNPSAQSILGFPPAHFIGMRFDEPFHAVDR
ncbi:MAG: PAS domain S-box protein, partial [Planctomycetota bacterium]